MKRKFLFSSLLLCLLVMFILPSYAATKVTVAFSSPLKANYTPSTAYKNSEYYEKVTNVTLTGNYADDLVAVAMSQEGYHEGNSTSDFGGGNLTGSGDYNEYGYAFNNSYGNWCAYFVSWCARIAGVPESMIKSSGSAGPTSLGVTRIPNDGSYQPKKGDLVFFRYVCNHYYTHVGIVAEVNGSKDFTIIEGNSYENNVRLKQRYYNDSYDNGIKCVDCAQDKIDQYYVDIDCFGSWENNNSLNGVPVNSLFVEPTYITLPINGTFDLNAEVTPAGANQTVHWSSNNTAVAAVDANGMVTAKAAGTVTIMAKSEDGTRFDSLTVYVPGVTYKGPSKNSQTIAIKNQI